MITPADDSNEQIKGIDTTFIDVNFEKLIMSLNCYNFYKKYKTNGQTSRASTQNSAGYYWKFEGYVFAPCDASENFISKQYPDPIPTYKIYHPQTNVIEFYKVTSYLPQHQ